MTARQVDPSSRAKKRHDLSPTPIVRKRKKRGAAASNDNIAKQRITGKSSSSAASASKISVDKPLTEKQRQFVEHWAKGDTLQNATLRAGFADDGLGYRLARQPNILALKAKLSAQYEEAAQMTRQKVMDMLIESYDMAKLMAEPSTMVAAAREVGKMCGYYAPVEHKMKVDVTGNIVVDRLNSMSDAELLKLITSGNAPLLNGPNT